MGLTIAQKPQTKTILFLTNTEKTHRSFAYGLCVAILLLCI